MTKKSRRPAGLGSEDHPSERVLESLKRGKDEMNLAEFPIALVAEAARPGQLTLHFSDTIPDKASGRLLDRSVTVHGTEEWGLPAAHDDDVMVALLQISHRTNWSKRIEFSRYELCQLLRWSMGGPSYERIYKALHRLSTTTYNYRHAWRDHTRKEWIPSQVFSYIQSLKINEANRRTQSGRCEVTWSDDFHQSLLAGCLKRLDYDLFISLKSPIAKRLYRFLDKRFGAGRTDYTRDLHTLAFEKIGIARSYKDAAQIKRVLRPAILELEKVGFLATESQEKRFQRVRRGQWVIHFRKSGKQSKKTKDLTFRRMQNPRKLTKGDNAQKSPQRSSPELSLPVKPKPDQCNSNLLKPSDLKSLLSPAEYEELRIKAKRLFPGGTSRTIHWAIVSMIKLDPKKIQKLR